MAQGQDRVPEDHPRTCVPHDFLDSRPHGRPVAVDGTTGAGRLVAAERAAPNSTSAMRHGETAEAARDRLVIRSPLGVMVFTSDHLSMILRLAEGDVKKAGETARLGGLGRRNQRAPPGGSLILICG